MSLQHQVELVVPFHDCDPMNVCWHGHYVKYLEIARCALLDQFNYGYQQMLESGYAWPVIDLQLRYTAPLVFDQKIIVQATLAEWDIRLKINYKILDAASGKRLTKASTTQVAVNMATQEMCFHSPAIIQQRLQEAGVIQHD